MMTAISHKAFMQDQLTPYTGKQKYAGRQLHTQKRFFYAAGTQERRQPRDDAPF
jgi:hypothetical protein